MISSALTLLNCAEMGQRNRILTGTISVPLSLSLITSIDQTKMIPGTCTLSEYRILLKSP